MHFDLDPRSPAPPSEQLADQVRFAICAGRLATGDQLPSVRQLASQVRVNPNTVGRAWRELMHEGVLETRRGSGVFVAESTLERCREVSASVVAERLARAVAEGLAAGLEEEEVLDLVRDACRTWRAAQEANEETGDGTGVDEPTQERQR